MNWSRFFLIIAWQNRGRLLAEAVILSFLIVAAALYGLPMQAVLYSVTLVTILRGCLSAYLLHRRWIRFRALETAVRQPAELAAAHLPCPPETASDGDAAEIDPSLPFSPEEQLYTRIAARMAAEQRRISQENEQQQRERSEYYTLWAHQIKTPISAMRLALQDEDSSLARQLSGSLTKIEQYVEMALMYPRMDGGRFDYVIRECVLDDILRSAIRRFSSEFIHRHLRLDFTPTGLTVLTDEKWLRFVVEQLLSNALKYTPAGTISLYAAAGKTLCIRDTGIGIDAADLPRIFEKGYTGINGRSHQRASGLGLYLCRCICTNLGHTLRIESAPGEGTCVFLSLESAELWPE